jgi:hypothetical protein
MSIDYIVSSLQPLVFDGPAPYTWERFAEMLPPDCVAADGAFAVPPRWRELETQLRNAMAVARNGAKYMREADGCSLYWKNRITACFTEKDVAKRQDLIDRVWWDAAGELTPPESPLGKGALATYAVRLKTAIRRSAASKEKGNAAFDRLTEDTKLTF